MYDFQGALKDIKTRDYTGSFEMLMLPRARIPLLTEEKCL